MTLLQQGCQTALTQIYERYKQDLWLLALSLLNDRVAAEDVVHDVFIQLVQMADRWPSSGSLRGFLMVCLANRARNVIRGRTRRERHELESYANAQVEKSPLQAVILNEQMRQLAEAMAQLPYEQREVVMLHFPWTIESGDDRQASGATRRYGQKSLPLCHEKVTFSV